MGQEMDTADDDSHLLLYDGSPSSTAVKKLLEIQNLRSEKMKGGIEGMKTNSEHRCQCKAKEVHSIGTDTEGLGKRTESSTMTSSVNVDKRDLLKNVECANVSLKLAASFPKYPRKEISCGGSDLKSRHPPSWSQKDSEKSSNDKIFCNTMANGADCSVDTSVAASSPKECHHLKKSSAVNDEISPPKRVGREVEHPENHEYCNDSQDYELVDLSIGPNGSSSRSQQVKPIELQNLNVNASKKTHRRKGERHWICQTCTKPFHTSKALREHEVVHTGARDFPCNICGKAFGTSANMRIHRLTHSDQRPFACVTCGATFRQKDSLKVHIRKHTGERPFKCNVCKMTFDRNFTLKNHLLTHASEKSFVCSVCGKAFSTRGGLNNHERLHLKESSPIKKKWQPRAKPGTGNWVCDECGKIYSTRSNLLIHQRTHSLIQITHVCPVCSKVYKSRDSMEVHMRRHTEDRPYHCSMCPRSFFRNYTLKLHILTHTGEKPHHCPFEGCTKSFAQSSSLTYHLRSHNKKKEGIAGNSSKRSRKDLKFPKNVLTIATKTNNSVSGDYTNDDVTETDTVQNLKLEVNPLVVPPNVLNHCELSKLGISNNLSPQMVVSALPTAWDNSDNLPMMGVVNSTDHVSQQQSLQNHSVPLQLQSQDFQKVILQHVPAETLPFLVSVPDGVL